MKVSFHVEARAFRDLIEHAAYFRDRSERAMTRFVSSAVQTIHGLAETPGLGAVREFRSAKLQDIRAWRVAGFPKYLIFYRVAQDGVRILRVLHSARDIEAIFVADEDETADDDGGT